MKFRITLKDPDGVYDGITDAAVESAATVSGLSESEQSDIEHTRREQIGEQLRKWVDGGEYITIEFDTDVMTATVIES